ncbi:MAG TPA: transcriptional regulator [Nitrospira sp.]|jgi:DNA-binding transcriptional regulator YiaG|nr:transcriptional regulator [Nitrospira sp.]
MKVKYACTTPAEIIAYRSKKNMNQTTFWSRVGTTQSGGSRYESGRTIPTPTKILLTIAYGTTKQAEAVVKALRDTTNQK